MKDASLDVRMNGVLMPDGRVLGWAEAFPRPSVPTTPPGWEPKEREPK